jgi:hypothetical protein
VNLAFDTKALAHVARKSVLQREPREGRDLDGEPFVPGIEAVDFWRNHDGQLGLLPELFCCPHDGKVDLAVRRIVWERIDGVDVCVRVDLLAFKCAKRTVVQNGGAGGVDEDCGFVLGGPFADAVKDGFDRREMVGGRGMDGNLVTAVSKPTYYRVATGQE